MHQNAGRPRGVNAASLLAFLAAACVSLIACSSPATSPSNEIDSVTAGRLSNLVSEATAGGASEEQLATLQAYVPGSAVTFEDLRAAYDRTFACLDNSGIPYSGVATYVDDAGYERITYNYTTAPSLTDEQSQRIADECQVSESLYVSILYDLQPGYVEAADRAFEEARPSIVACLRDNGVPIDDEATRSELVNATITLISPAGSDPAQPATGPDCMYLLPDIGY